MLLEILMNSERIPTNSSPLVSVVVATFNNGDILRTCLQSLLRQDYPNLEIILVDNGSTESIPNILGHDFPTVRYVRIEKNSGFAGGNNCGIEQAGGKYIALLNNDAVADPGWISALVEAGERRPRLGAIGSIVVDGNSPDKLDSFGVGVALDGMSRQAMHGLPASAKDLMAKDMLAVSGCACLLRAEALKETGLFDERFFAYCEDTDLCLRLVRSGWQVTVIPEARVVHYYSRTGGKFSLLKVYWVERNHFWVALKNYPLGIVAALPLLTCWRLLVMATAVFRGTPSVKGFSQSNGLCRTLVTIALAQVAALTKLPVMLATRFAFRSQCRLRGLRWAKLLWHQRMTIQEAVTGLGRIAKRESTR